MMNLNKNSNEIICYPSEGSSNSFELEDSSFWFKHRNLILEKIFKRFPINGDFADIGGGNGYQLMKIAELNKSNKNILIEPSQQGCLNAKKRKIKEVYNMTFEDFNFRKYNLNGIGLFDVLEHIKNDYEFLSNLLNKLKKGSRIYVTVPAHHFLWSDVDPYGGHFRRYNKKMVNTISSKLDVTLEYFSYFFAYLLPISYILRALPYKLGKRLTKEQLKSQEKNQHNPTGLTKVIFNYFEEKELNKIINSKISFGASCVFILEKINIGRKKPYSI